MQLTSAESCAIINHVAAVMQQTKYKNADMAESADALASGASPRKGVEVQVLLSAPTLYFVCNSKFPCIEYADMAESADALASGASPRKGVEVQVLLSAPKRTLECSGVLFLSFYGKGVANAGTARNKASVPARMDDARLGRMGCDFIGCGSDAVLSEAI